MKEEIIKWLGGFTKEEYDKKLIEVENQRQNLQENIKQVRIEVEGFYDLDTMKELNSRKEFIEKLFKELTKPVRAEREDMNLPEKFTGRRIFFSGQEAMEMESRESAINQIIDYLEEQKNQKIHCDCIICNP